MVKVTGWVSKSLLHTRTAVHRHSLGGVTSRRREIELYECLLLVVSAAEFVGPLAGWFHS